MFFFCLFYNVATELLYSYTDIYKVFFFIIDNNSDSILTDWAFLIFMTLLCIDKME